MSIFCLLLTLNLLTLSHQLEHSSSSSSSTDSDSLNFQMNSTLELRNSPSSFLFHFEEAWKTHLTLNHSPETQPTTLKSLIETDTEFLLGQIRLFEEIFDDDSQELIECYSVLVKVAFDFLQLESLHLIQRCRRQERTLEFIQKAFDFRLKTVKRLIQKNTLEEFTVHTSEHSTYQHEYLWAWNIGRLWKLNQLAESAPNILLNTETSSLEQIIFAFHLQITLQNFQKSLHQFSFWTANESIQRIQFYSNFLHQATASTELQHFKEIKTIADSLSPCNFWHTF